MFVHHSRCSYNTVCVVVAVVVGSSTRRYGPCYRCSWYVRTTLLVVVGISYNTLGVMVVVIDAVVSVIPVVAVDAVSLFVRHYGCYCFSWYVCCCSKCVHTTLNSNDKS